MAGPTSAPLTDNLALSTCCLGLHPSHTLEAKLSAAAKYGFQGIEIVYGDLERYSVVHNLNITSAANQIRKLCDELKLHILALCPFENFEGYPSLLSERLETAQRWMTIARILGAEYVQVPAQYDTSASTDEATIVTELQALADLGTATEPVISIAYEPMGWSIRYSTWESTLRLTSLVNRSNFGICIDTFHIASKIWGDPSHSSGKYPSGDRELVDSLGRLVREFPLEKLFYIQLSGGEKFSPVYSSTHPWYLEGEAKEFTWSKHGRPFPLESGYGDYMPVVEITEALFQTGYKGWVSLETFDRRMRVSAYKVETAAERAESPMTGRSYQLDTLNK
ncbi:hypothetical protein N0V90_012616 [Kalmusia sp. IMI 367209]|nr:hypothetical protein N0V90_012616 [Kalmusia sp. IMI 367209]